MSRGPIASLIALLLASLACTVTIPTNTFGGLTGSGDVITLTPDLADFDRVQISHAFEATVTQGRNFEVTIRIDDNLVDYLEARVVGRTLVIGLKQSVGFNLGNTTLEADITMPALAGLEASGASRATLAGFESTDDIRLGASGASTITGEIMTGDVDISISGASTVSLGGIAATMNLQASGASTADLEDFAVVNARVDLSGASRGTVHVTGELDIEASGASHVTYTGDPSLGSVNLSGASSMDSK